MDQGSPEVAIPIQNIYYLLCYAWDKLHEGGVIDVDAIPTTTLVDLFARVLVSGVTHILRRGLDRGYAQREEVIPGVRGRIRVSETLRRDLLRQGLAACAFDELTHDVLSNQIVKATVIRLLLLEPQALDDDNRAALTDLTRRLRLISPVPITDGVFRRVQLHRNNAYYGFLLDVCALLHRNLLVDPSTGGVRFRDFARDEGQMAYVFQRFAKHFLAREQSRFEVTSPTLDWSVADRGSDAVTHLPIMKTDIVLDEPGRTIIIDTKYYRDMFQRHYKRTVHSDHLYQLYAYMRHMRLERPSETSIAGVLLYPTVNESVDLRYVIDGHPVRIYSIDLDQPWEGIHRAMLDLVA